jgi:GTP-binding protein EngB required for normal cell division
LGERLRDGRFYVVCVGQFKRGKSTLINALVGEEILPTGVVPVTSVVTVLRHGEQPGARVRLGAGDWVPIGAASLSDYVSEDRNPDNRKGVSGVEVFVPAPLLAHGMSLVDTPGLGSVTDAGAAATKAFVPHIDAALVVLGADPPISSDELQLIEGIAAVTPRLVFVLNKADRVGEADRREAARFTQRVLRERLGLSVDQILVVSALEALKNTEGRYDWVRLVGTLEALARTSGGDMLRDAETRGLRALVDALRAEIGVQTEALVRPLADSEAHVQQLRQAQREAAEALQDLSHRLLGVQERLLLQFDKDRDAFFARSLPEAAAEVRARLSRAPATTRAAAIELAADIAMRWLKRWEREHEPRAEALYREATSRFVDLVNAAAEELARAPGLERLPRLTAEPGFRARRQLRYTHMLRTAPVSLAERIRDLLRPPRSRQRVIARDAVTYLERLLEVNSARIKNDFSDRVVESRRLLAGDLTRRLAEVSAAADRALRHARDTRASGADAVRARLEWLERQRAAVNSLSSG